MNARTEMLGVYYDMPAADYFAIPAINNSFLKDASKSMAHAHALHIDPARPVREQSAAMFSGTLIHCAQLESSALAQRYVVVPEDAPRRPTAAQLGAKKPSPESAAAMEWWAAFNASLAGREVITADQQATAQAQLAAIQRVPELATLFSTGQGEVTVVWTDIATGLLCKCRPDWVHTLPDGRVIVIDLKSTADPSPNEFARTAHNFGYHRAARWYTRGWEAATGAEVAAFIFGAVSSSWPFLAIPYMFDEAAAKRADAEIDDLMPRIAECKQTGIWPAFGSGVQLLSLPSWVK